MKLHMLTTTDNPYNPFTQFDEWNSWDTRAGYNSIALLARVVVTSDELSEADQDVAVENAIFEIITENVSGMHSRIAEPTTTV